MLEQIDILSDDEDKNFVKPGDQTIYVKTKFDKYKLYKSGETIFVNKESGKIQKCYIKKYFVSSGGKTYKFSETLRADWYLDSTKIANNNKMCNVPLDSTGIYNLKACINYTSGDTISIIDTIKVNVNIIDKPVVFFYKHKGYLGEFGFEKYEHPEFKDDLSLEKIKINKNDYYVPWLSLSVGQTANLEARISVPTLYSGLRVKFESSNPSRIMIMGVTEYDSTSLKQGYNKISIPILANDTTGFNIFCPIFVKNENDSIIGKINVVSEKEDNYTGFNLTLVKVITDTLNRPINLVKIKTNLQKKLKDFSYKQAFVKWEERFIEYDTLDLTGVIDSRYLSKVESEYNKSIALRDTLINWYKIKKGGNLKERFIIFIVDKEGAYKNGGQLNGRAKFPKLGEDNYLVIYYQAKENYDTYIHELGHNFNLQHPFGQFPSIQKHSTKNIMDYGRKRNYFWLWQCKQIRNFKFID